MQQQQGGCVVNEESLPWVALKDLPVKLQQASADAQDFFQHRRKMLGRAAGGKNLGCSLTEVEPGKAAWPFHYHLANEESIYVLEGTGTLRVGDKTHPVKKGDYIALPTGKDHAHQLINTHPTDNLRYLCMSTMISPEVAVYPDSDKIGCLDWNAKMMKMFTANTGDVDYFAGEGKPKAIGEQ